MAMLLGVPNSSYIDLTDIAGYGYTFDKTFDKKDIRTKANMHYFCTLFDRNYLYKGVAMYKSLESICSSFHLFILCMDDDTYDTLKLLGLENCSLIRLVDFEDEQLLQAKQDRSRAEYCWTCTPSLPL